MRLFAAVVPPREALAHLSGALGRVRSDDKQVRWTRVESWHLTLAFYGSGTPEQARERTGWLEERLRGRRPAQVRLAGAGTFRGVLWAGVGGDVETLREIARAAGAEEEGPNGSRPWHPHLTLARWRSPRRPATVREVVRGMADYRGPSWVVSDVILMNSELHPSGARYTEQARFRLSEP